MNDWYVCEYDGEEFNFKFTVVGTYVGNKGERIDKHAILNLWDRASAWNELANGDFELEDN